MSEDESELKQKLRTELRSRVKLIAPDWRAQHSARTCDRLREQKLWRDERSVLFYSPLADEMDVTPLMHEAHTDGKTVLLPRFDAGAGTYTICELADPHNDLVPAKFGILEPHPDSKAFSLNHLDFALVPGVGFALTGARLGRGRGFYDRLLAQVSGVKCGIAFDEQILPQLPTAPHDVLMNFVLTPTRWIVVS